MATSFENLTGETVGKAPGELSGAPFALSGLEGCTVTLLDFSSSVNVVNCTDCKILIGPTASASFQGCSGCTVMVACGEFMASGCFNTSFGLYSASAPSIDSCSGLTFACWNAAYPGLSEQFQSAGLQPANNQWKEVNDMSEGEGLQNYEINEFSPAEYWEVELEGFGPVENPVSAPPPAAAFMGGDDFFGTVSSAAPPADNHFGDSAPSAAADMFGAPAAEVDMFGDTSAAMPLGDDFAAPPAMPAAVSEMENPKVVKMRDAMRIRLKEVDQQEVERKAKFAAEAKSYLDTLYANRADATSRRKKNNREAESLTGGQEAKGSSYWEQIIEYIDFSMDTNKGKDMSRYKSVLFTAKAKNKAVTVA